jgi:putative hemolysin
MGANRQATREISYASSASTRGGRAVIRVLENATGRLRLIRRAKGYEQELALGRDFWQVMVERYGLGLDVARGRLSDIPVSGPLVVVSNHPYGILDGLMLGHILSITRGDFRILANHVFRRAEELDRVILPISFDDSRQAVQLNLQTRKDALDYLRGGGAIGVFPGGTVATAKTPMAPPLDPAWRTFTARMIQKSNATVVPVYFEGHNSRLFQLASHLHYTLRMALLIKEFRARVDEPVRICIGAPISPQKLASLGHDSKSMMEFLRQQTYALSPKPLKSTEHGFEFEERWKA